MIAVREILVELMEKFERGLVARDTDSQAVITDNAAARAAFAEMPSYDGGDDEGCVSPQPAATRTTAGRRMTSPTSTR